MHRLKRYLYWSLLIHALFLLFGVINSTYQQRKKNAFVVFGACSRYDAKTQYKSTKITPFISHKKKRSGNGSGRGGQQNKRSAKGHAKNTGKKQKQQKHPIKPKPTVTKKGSKQKASSSKPIQKIKHKGIPEAGNKKHTKNSGKSAPQKIARKHKKLRDKPKIKLKKNTAPAPEPELEPEPITSPESVETKTEELADQSIQAEQVDSDVPTAPADELGTTTGEAANGEEYNGFSIDGSYDAATISQFQYHVQNEIDRVWQPPVGVPKGTICSILFILDNNGNVTSCTFAKRSPVLIYDLSIMRIAKELCFHESLWGKQFKIDFCQ